jgi:hypothetical protein
MRNRFQEATPPPPPKASALRRLSGGARIPHQVEGRQFCRQRGRHGGQEGDNPTGTSVVVI